MDNNESKCRYQTITYWEQEGYDDEGEVTVLPPKELVVRIEEGLRETLDPRGNTIASDFLLNVPQRVPVGSIFRMGSLPTVPSSDGFYQAIDYSEVPDLKARKVDRHATLMRFSNQLPKVRSPLGKTLEFDLAFGLHSMAMEVDTAFTLFFLPPDPVEIFFPEETDTALPLKGVEEIVAATETDTALPLSEAVSPPPPGTILVVSETDSAIALVSPTGLTSLWSWVNINKTNYDAYVNVSNPIFNQDANSRLYAVNNNGTFSSPSPINFPVNYRTPQAETTGRLTCYLDTTEASTNTHCMIRAQNTSEFSSNWYLTPRIRYRFQSTIDLSSSSDWSSLSWGLLFQLYPGIFPAGHNVSPPVAMYVKGRGGGGSDIFQLLLQGNTGDPPLSNWDNINTYDWAFSPGVWTYQMEWITDPDSSGPGSLFVLKMDTGTGTPTTERVNVTVPHGLMYSGHDSTDAYLTMLHGLYTTKGIPASYPSVEVYNGTLWRVNS